MPSPSQQTVADTRIDAPAGVVLDVIGDIDAYPQWASGIRAARVLEADDMGWPVRAEFTVASNALTDTHVLVYTWDVDEDGTGVVSWTLESSRALSALQGSYTLTADGPGTRVEYRLAVQLRIAVPALLRRRAEAAIVAGALDSLRERVGQVAPGGAAGGTAAP